MVDPQHGIIREWENIAWGYCKKLEKAIRKKIIPSEKIDKKVRAYLNDIYINKYEICEKARMLGHRNLFSDNLFTEIQFKLNSITPKRNKYCNPVTFKELMRAFSGVKISNNAMRSFIKTEEAKDDPLIRRIARNSYEYRNESRIKSFLFSRKRNNRKIVGP